MIDTSRIIAQQIVSDLAQDDLGLVAISNALVPCVRTQLAEYATQRFQQVPDAKIEVVGSNNVQQRVSSISMFENDNPITKLRTEVNTLLNKELGHLFATPLDLNVQELVRYNTGSIGITPHIDPIKSINLVVIVVLQGKGCLCRCKNREGDDPVEIPSEHGNIILLRAEGFSLHNNRPFHYINNIEQERYVIVFRQYRENESPNWFSEISPVRNY
jgi:hypothetical protein